MFRREGCGHDQGHRTVHSRDDRRGGLLAVRSAPRQRCREGSALRLTTFLVAVSLFASAASAQPTGPVVAVPGGDVRGTTGEDALVFRGVPYAAPPLGELRWRAPQPV